MSASPGFSTNELEKIVHKQLCRMNKICNKKCKVLNLDNRLNKAEENCLDRCVFKFHHARDLLNKLGVEGLVK